MIDRSDAEFIVQPFDGHEKERHPQPYDMRLGVLYGCIIEKGREEVYTTVDLLCHRRHALEEQSWNVISPSTETLQNPRELRT